MQQVKRIVTILEVLADKGNGITLSDISERVELAKSTTHRILQALKKLNMVVQNPETKKYSIGPGILSLSRKAYGSMEIIEMARPFLRKLRDETGETAYLSVLKNDKVVCVDKIETESNLRYYVEMGSSMPLHCTAAGKAIIAYQDEELIKHIISIQKMSKFTNFTITDPNELFIEYKRVRIRGYAICNNEMEDMITAIAVPLFTSDGKVSSSITVIGLTSNLTDKGFDNIVKKLKEASISISSSYVEGITFDINRMS
jgi:DNA-binding IclR family transcriptional regulator